MLSKYIFISFQFWEAKQIRIAPWWFLRYCVFFYETTDIWRCKKFCCEIFLAFWVLWTLRVWMTGRLFSWDLHTSSGWGWRQLKSNIGFLVPTKNCPSEKFIYFRPKTQNQHTFKPTIKRILLYTLHQMHIFVQLKRYICISEHRGLKSWGFLHLSFLIEGDGWYFFWRFKCQRQKVDKMNFSNWTS